MPDRREQIIDEIGRCLARAAVDALLAESIRSEEGPGAANPEALKSSSTELPDGDHNATAPAHAT